jgi:hypothetical protein
MARHFSVMGVTLARSAESASAVHSGLGRVVALSHRSFTLARFTDIFGASISEATMRPNPRCTRRSPTWPRRSAMGGGAIPPHLILVYMQNPYTDKKWRCTMTSPPLSIAGRGPQRGEARGWLRRAPGLRTGLRSVAADKPAPPPFFAVSWVLRAVPADAFFATFNGLSLVMFHGRVLLLTR